MLGAGEAPSLARHDRLSHVVGGPQGTTQADAGALRPVLEELGALGERMDHEREAIAELEA